MNNKLIILDRDGVINHDSNAYIKSAEEWQPIQGSIEAIAQLSKAGYIVTVATNQSGLARGYFDEYALAGMHEKLYKLVEEAGGKVDGIFLCPHSPDEGCDCRKPATGMLEQIEREFNLPLEDCWFVGDSGKDLLCGLARDCQPVLVLTGKGVETEHGLSDELRAKTKIFPDLRSAVDSLLIEMGS